MISVVIPVYNEAELLARSVRTVNEYLVMRTIEHEVVVVSNGSTDSTVQAARALAEENSWLRVVELPERGPGAAFVAGVREARGEFIVSLDADLSSELKFLDFANDLLKYADMVVGSKTLGRQRRSAVRVIGSQLYLLFTYLLFDLTISDFSIGAKAYRRDAILSALSHLDTWTGYVFELCLYLRLRGKRILQIGIECDDKRKSRFNLIHEAFHRYTHLFRCRRLLSEPHSWFRSA